MSQYIQAGQSVDITNGGIWTADGGDTITETAGGTFYAQNGGNDILMDGGSFDVTNEGQYSSPGGMSFYFDTTNAATGTLMLDGGSDNTFVDDNSSGNLTVYGGSWHAPSNQGPADAVNDISNNGSGTMAIVPGGNQTFNISGTGNTYLNLGDDGVGDNTATVTATDFRLFYDTTSEVLASTVAIYDPAKGNGWQYTFTEAGASSGLPNVVDFFHAGAQAQLVPYTG